MIGNVNCFHVCDAQEDLENRFWKQISRDPGLGSHSVLTIVVFLLQVG